MRKAKVALALYIQDVRMQYVPRPNVLRPQVVRCTRYTKHIFSQQKYDTMEELQEIKRNMNKKKAYKR